MHSLDSDCCIDRCTALWTLYMSFQSRNACVMKDYGLLGARQHIQDAPPYVMSTVAWGLHQDIKPYRLGLIRHKVHRR